MADPTGDSTISNLPLAQTLTGAENLVMDQTQAGTLKTVRIPLTTLTNYTQGAVQSGPTGSRPTSPALGQTFFDTTLGQPIWVVQVSPVIWVNASGTTV